MSITENVIARVNAQMENIDLEYKLRAEAVNKQILNGGFPSAFESAGLVEAQARAEGAFTVRLTIESHGNDVDMVIKRLQSRLHSAICSNVILTNQKIRPIYEALIAIEAGKAEEESAIGGAVICGDFPAPCNCDNPITHSGR